jgi:hypothetical protein
LFFPGEVVVDAELGILLRCISSSGTQPEMRYELRDVVTGSFEAGDFRPDIPAGLRVVEEPDDAARPGQPGWRLCQAGSQGGAISRQELPREDWGSGVSSALGQETAAGSSP